jgi:peroxiredoxin
MADLDGMPVHLGEAHGREVLLLFWNPGCGFCTHMLDDLRALEEDLLPDALNLLIVSAGTVEDNRAMNLRSPIVLDQDFKVARDFGVNATPCAILIDADGRIASGIVAGATAILNLVRSNIRERPKRVVTNRTRRYSYGSEPV